MVVPTTLRKLFTIPGRRCFLTGPCHLRPEVHKGRSSAREGSRRMKSLKHRKLPLAYVWQIFVCQLSPYSSFPSFSSSVFKRLQASSSIIHAALSDMQARKWYIIHHNTVITVIEYIVTVYIYIYYNYIVLCDMTRPACLHLRRGRLRWKCQDLRGMRSTRGPAKLRPCRQSMCPLLPLSRMTWKRHWGWLRSWRRRNTTNHPFLGES